MPEVVSQVESLEKAASASGNSNGAKAPRIKSWAASPKLFPCDVSPDGKRLMQEVRRTVPGMHDCCGGVGCDTNAETGQRGAC